MSDADRVREYAADAKILTADNAVGLLVKAVLELAEIVEQQAKELADLKASIVGDGK